MVITFGAVLAVVLVAAGGEGSPDEKPSGGTGDGTSALPTPSLSLPSGLPSDLPTLPSGLPSDLPSGFPSDLPSGFPTGLPSDLDSLFPDPVGHAE
ncbi:hypothetical protein [Streptomyces deccanensis]|uniref:hypothetical protein n=1 Tax=Streptomyces deccanensis TaxID=424188 RepID=UPI001EFB90F9|nr:hypothetical protein [Streptomyces deccanensis]ULR48949.1 hypothetical protein L3078_06480 [Streptomyces deccanensis]